jgi:hypothetical protein
VQADGDIMTCATCKPVATVLCYSMTPHGGPLAGMGGRSYDPTRWGYAVDRMPHGRIDKIGHVRHCPHHHYATTAFNALDTA